MDKHEEHEQYLVGLPDNCPKCGSEKIFVQSSKGKVSGSGTRCVLYEYKCTECHHKFKCLV